MRSPFDVAVTSIAASARDNFARPFSSMCVSFLVIFVTVVCCCGAFVYCCILCGTSRGSSFVGYVIGLKI